MVLVSCSNDISHMSGKVSIVSRCLYKISIKRGKNYIDFLLKKKNNISKPLPQTNLGNLIELGCHFAVYVNKPERGLV